MRTERNIYSFLRKNHLTIISLLLALFSLHLALTGKREFERGYLLKEIFSYTLAPAGRVVLSVEDAAKDVWSDYIALMGVKEENDSLTKTVLALREENNRLKEEIRLNERLRSLVDYRESLPYYTTGAAIIGFNMERWTRTIVVDKGADAGIMKDRAVIAPQGIVGRTLDVQGSTTRVLLATDLRSNIDVIVERTRVKGVVEGNGTDGLILKYVRQVDDVQVGDQVMTSGLSGVFPKGLVVGEVTKIEKGGDNFFKHVEVRPSMDIGKIEEVLVLREDAFHY
ncbi:MAG TPA: rod shape-determining protein MreC [Thermodesulfobacteriota bacterium]